MSAKDDAKALVDEFAAAGDADVWPNINKVDLIEPLKTRIDKPDTINQKKTSLCGPADFIRDLAIDRPVEYVQTVVSLYKTGQAKIKSLSIKPCSDLKKYKIPATDTIDPVDWIILASLRDSDNWFFDYQSASDDASAITTPSRKEKWLKDVGYTTVKNEANIVFTKDLQNARDASALFKSGHKIALLINANMLSREQSKVNTASVIPDHWISLKSEISINGIEGDPASTVSFDCYTWGSTRKVPFSTLELNIKRFLWNYYGYVAAKM